MGSQLFYVLSFSFGIHLQRSLNYFSPGNAIGNVLHIFADVLPYHIWGNDENDTTPVINRIFSRADLWRELGREKYDEFIEKNKQNLKSIITQIKKSFNYLNKT